MEHGTRALVIDAGSGYCKAGFAGDAAPHTIVPSVVGVARHGSPLHDLLSVGEEAIKKQGILTIKRPIENGLFGDQWDNIVNIFHHIFYNELRVAPEEQPLLLTESPLNNSPIREKTTEMVFETFHVPSFHLAMQPALALHASGRTTGLVFDSGDTVTYAAPVYDGVVVRESIRSQNIGGRDMDRYLLRAFMDKDYYWASGGSYGLVRDIKEKACYVALDFEEESKSRQTKDIIYMLPDGNTVELEDEVFRGPEAFFRPTMVGLESEIGFHHLISTSIHNCEIGLQPELYKNIMITGGTTLLPGFVQRMHKELALLCPGMEVNLIAPPERRHAAWTGGSILASLADYRNKWCTRQDYDEFGPGIIHRSTSGSYQDLIRDINLKLTPQSVLGHSRGYVLISKLVDDLCATDLDYSKFVRFSTENSI